jgi:hypothetical protein
MTANPQTVPDERLRRALAELAAGPDGTALVAEVLRAVDATPQADGLAWPPRFSGRHLAIIAATGLLLVMLVGAVALFSGMLPAPEPVPGPIDPSPSTATSQPTEPGANAAAEDFVRPFTYTMPKGEIGILASRSSPPSQLYSFYRGAAYGIEVFLIQGYVHRCPYFYPASTPGGTSVGTASIRTSPDGFLADLRDVGVGVGAVSTTTVGGYPAVVAQIDPDAGACFGTTLHVDGTGLKYRAVEPALDRPATIFVASVDSLSIGIRIWAADAETLKSWLPRAMLFVDSLQFVDGPGPTLDVP